MIPSVALEQGNFRADLAHSPKAASFWQKLYKAYALKRTFAKLGHVRALLGETAYAHLKRLGEQAPDIRTAFYAMARFLCHTGLHDHGIAFYETLLRFYGEDERPPELYIVHYLQMLMFGSPELQSNAKLHDRHIHWGRFFAGGGIYAHYDNPLSLNRRLKIGYTCHFITNSTSTTLLQPLLRAHRRDRVEIFLYCDEPKQSISDETRGIVEHWRDTYDLSHDDFCALVRRDGIDLLVELNGHGLFNRYPVITRHPVPVQVAYYNYACTTGIPGMDYTLVGEDIDIRHLQPFYSETIFTMRGVSHALPVGSHFPALTPPPFEANGRITFCSFGQAHKVTREQILRWCEIMKQVPGSVFFMKAQVLDDPHNRAAFMHHFNSGGIDETRLILQGNSDYATLLSCYARVDIALDTYPCNGGTTTTEAILQGVPVVSLIADRYASQTARNGIESAGHPELLCRSEEEFIQKAVSLAKDSERLRYYRRHLREDFKHSPRGDVEGFAASLEDAYASMWERYVHTRQAAFDGIDKVE